MTIEDAKVIGFGSIALLIFFVTARLIYTRENLDLWGVVRRYVVVRIAGIDPDDTGIEPAISSPVLSALEAENTGTSIPVRDIATRADVLDILARGKADGKYIFTANKLADLFTGTTMAASRNVILEEIAAIRNPEKPAMAHRPGAPLKRPANGW